MLVQNSFQPPKKIVRITELIKAWMYAVILQNA